MALAETSVYLGFWTNWSHGAINGLTYTTTLENGALFIAFLALFVTYTGTCFWSIASFTVHQTLSRQAPQNTIYHQQQAILRTSDTSTIALWRLIKLTWAWRKTMGTTSFKSTLIPLATSLATLSAFTIASIFSSRVASSRGGEVLIVGSNCAVFNGSLMTQENHGMTQYYTASRIRSSASYKANCYSGSKLTEGCHTFARSSLPFIVTHGNPCPFPGKDAICGLENGSIRLDSGFLNSHYDLGINSPPSSRFLYRSVTECSPIRDKGYIRFNNMKTPKTAEFLYGDDSVHCGRNSDGCTMDVGFGDGLGSRAARSQYTLSVATKWQLPKDMDFANTWEPIPELSVPNTDVNVLFLQPNSILYATPVYDPWFDATYGPLIATLTRGNITVYASNQPAKALACAQQYQFCNPSLPQDISCTPPMGIHEAVIAASSTLFKEKNSRDAFDWSALAIRYMANGFTEIVTILGGTALLAGDTLSAAGQDSLPNNQWELELEHWFKITLADIQRAILDQATGPTDPRAASFHSPPKTAAARTICNSQKIRSDSYTSFNVLGLIIIFSIGGLIILISACLPLVTARLQRSRNPFASLEWISNDTLQLQRLAHEAVGAGEWKGACDDYPFTRKHDLLAVLDITDRKHPVLRVEPEAAETTEIEPNDKEQCIVTAGIAGST
ncbi:hypothetical protein COCMIDRAFT_109565 [Bipolaris oryzae ATCC 44560]|uniref:Uncharacterized protein n=1 Tax=Bipolaris oryzae ATCC 44560 TaxID=930090 RepID=W6YX89_COCMI|nr:uncharacterized protein COCMIDRAFT_109565 [Bipolaris oryzae ATCC 44560]EUC40139.1 hypothetical protein COCMIDRAFT_109565 [Bipolaris oryzae ATCC 44560]